MRNAPIAAAAVGISTPQGDGMPYTCWLLAPFEETHIPALSAQGVDRKRALAGLAAPFPSAVIALSPDGRLAAYVDGDGSLHTISQDGVQVTLTGSIFGLQPEPMHAIAWGAPRWVIGSTLRRAKHLCHKRLECFGCLCREGQRFIRIIHQRIRVGCFHFLKNVVDLR